MPVEHVTTRRLLVRDWRPIIQDGARRSRLEADLASIRTGDVLAHLPLPLQLDKDGWHLCAGR